MAETNEPKKTGAKKLSLEEYAQIKEKRAKERNNMNMPWFINSILIAPVIILVGLILIYIFYVKTLPIR